MTDFNLSDFLCGFIVQGSLQHPADALYDVRRFATAAALTEKTLAKALTRLHEHELVSIPAAIAGEPALLATTLPGVFKLLFAYRGMSRTAMLVLPELATYLFDVYEHGYYDSEVSATRWAELMAKKYRPPEPPVPPVEGAWSDFHVFALLTGTNKVERAVQVWMAEKVMPKVMADGRYEGAFPYPGLLNPGNCWYRRPNGRPNLAALI